MTSTEYAVPRRRFLLSRVPRACLRRVTRARRALELVSGAFPERAPGERAAGTKALPCEAHAFGGDDDGERLAIDLDLAAERSGELQSH